MAEKRLRGNRRNLPDQNNPAGSKIVKTKKTTGAGGTLEHGRRPGGSGDHPRSVTMLTLTFVFDSNIFKTLV